MNNELRVIVMYMGVGVAIGWVMHWVIDCVIRHFSDRSNWIIKRLRKDIIALQETVDMRDAEIASLEFEKNELIAQLSDETP